MEAFRVSRYGLKYCKRYASVHDPQLATRNAQQKDEPYKPYFKALKLNEIIKAGLTAA